MSTIRTLLITVALAFPVAAWPHGGSDNAGKHAPARKVQKAWGIAGDVKAAARTIEIRMTDDMRFTPDALSVRTQ